MSVLVACEESGVVTEAFRRRGFEAMSCDLEPREPANPGPHYRGDVRDVLAHPLRFFSEPIELMVAHPPCTYLAVSGAKHLYMLDGNRVVLDDNGERVPNLERRRLQDEALDFVRLLLDADIPRIALENPVSVISSRIRKPDQIVQPWQYGHGEVKQTCLWLKNLPPLTPTDIVEGREARVWRMPPGPERQKLRSRTLAGIAEAMADQWGAVLRA